MLANFIGQEKLKGLLRRLLEQSRKTRRPCSHFVLAGPPKSGKSALASAFAEEVGPPAVLLAEATTIEGSRDLLPWLTNTTEGSILILKDIDRLPAVDRDRIVANLADWFARAIETFSVDMPLGEGSDKRTICLPLRPFTLIGTTTRPARISPAIQKSGIFVYDLAPYAEGEFPAISRRMAGDHGLAFSEEALALVLSYCA